MNLQIHTHKTSVLAHNSSYHLPVTSQPPVSHHQTSTTSQPVTIGAQFLTIDLKACTTRPGDNQGAAAFISLRFAIFSGVSASPAAHIVVDSVTIKHLGCRLLSHRGFAFCFLYPRQLHRPDRNSFLDLNFNLSSFILSCASF